ncbi:MAG: dihydroorotase [Desulfobacteraceae bacterium]|jgi:dihydroorotase|nr:dihydroorotase [Desulfobacteraceae bacterium]
MRIRISGGRIIDPGRSDTVGDVVVEDGRIRSVGPTDAEAADRIVDARNCLVVPGLIDIHVHLREPGHEYKETIASGAAAAAVGGFAAVCAMPNTSPVNDNAQVTRFILDRAGAAGAARVYPVASITRGLKGDQLSEFAELKAAGAVAFSDDGRPVVGSRMMRRAMEYARGFDMPIVSHCEELDLVGDGVMNEGVVATRLGLAGIPNAAESIMVMRDIALAELTGTRLHIAHVSCAESIAAIRAAKDRGVRVTAETAPHYFTLTEAAVAEYDTRAKMNPPLRTEADRQAVRQALADGTLDAIATDHAPHSILEKDVEFDQAANGIIGLETALPLSLQLAADGVLSLTDLISKLTVGPARILGLPCGLIPGAAADLTVIDPHRSWTVEAERFASLSRNCPFDGWQVTGRAVLTMVDGRIVYEALAA